MAIRTLWKYVIGRTRTVFQNYNVIERAEKIMETEKRVSPRHPGTEAKFKVLVQGTPDLKTELEKKPTELLDRLKVVKVTSETSEEGKGQRPLPQKRDALEPPTYGFEEPQVMPEGKCSLKQALEFISQHKSDSKNHTVESIAKAHKMKQVDVENIVKHFNVFQLYISREGKGVAKSTMESLGVSKVIEPAFRSKYAHLETEGGPKSSEKPSTE